MSTTPRWPAVIHYRGDDELLYVHDEAQWLQDPDLSQWRYDPQDRLIDSTGECFSLAFDAGKTRIVSTGDNIPLETFSALIQAHLFALAQTCVSKVVLRDYDDGFDTLSRLER